MDNPLKINSYKIVVVGDCAVGKSSLTIRYVNNNFSEFQDSTIGATYITKKITCPNEIINLEIWDTAGQERYRSIAPLYYRNAVVALVVYDITDYDSFMKAKQWIKELRVLPDPNMIIFLVGTKYDLKNKRQIEFNLAKSYADENNFFFFETSAKTNYNVNELFELIVQKLPKKETIEMNKQQIVDIDDDFLFGEKKRKCCRNL